MAIPETLGERLRDEMKRKGLKNADIAETAGVHEKTVSKWLTDRQVPDAEALDAVAASLGVSSAYLRYGERQTARRSVVAEESPAYAVPRSLKGAPLVWLQEFLAELARAGLTQHQVDAARELLTNAEAYVWYAGGLEHEPTEAEILEGMKDLATGIRVRYGLPIPPRT